MNISDLRNPKRTSGYDRVSVDNGGSTRPKPFRAEAGLTGKYTGQGPNYAWRGPRRATAVEAAQDYCDYVNAGHTAPPLRKLKSAGHKNLRPSLPADPEVQAALGVLRDARGQLEGRQGYVYLIIEVNPGGGLSYGKVGFSTNPKARVAELQTGNPRPLALHVMKKGTPDDEAALHAKYAANNILQEWFRITKDLLLEFNLDAAGEPFGKKAVA